jgi:hypothetical protein
VGKKAIDKEGLLKAKTEMMGVVIKEHVKYQGGGSKSDLGH